MRFREKRDVDRVSRPLALSYSLALSFFLPSPISEPRAQILQPFLGIMGSGLGFPLARVEAPSAHPGALGFTSLEECQSQAFWVDCCIRGEAASWILKPGL